MGADAAPHSFDADATYLTFAWAPNAKAARYAVQIRAVGADEWADATVRGPVLKKKNLQPGTAYECRYRPRDGLDFVAEEWSAVSAPASTLAAGAARPAAPTKAGGDAASLTVAWEQGSGMPYELQMLEWSEGGGFGAWRSLSSALGNTSCRKKNLGSGATYLFRVRSAAAGSPFSLASAPLTTSALAAGFKQMLGLTLCRADGSTVSTDTLAGKVVAVYFSAHWCGPCRQFTPELAKAASTLRDRGFEVVFVSCDKSEPEFNEYHKTMDGVLAIPFDEEDTRSAVQSSFQVNGIPRCIVFDSASGKVLQSNAVELGGAQGIVQAFDSWKIGASASSGGCGGGCSGAGCC